MLDVCHSACRQPCAKLKVTKGEYNEAHNNHFGISRLSGWIAPGAGLGANVDARGEGRHDPAYVPGKHAVERASQLGSWSTVCLPERTRVWRVWELWVRISLRGGLWLWVSRHPSL